MAPFPPLADPSAFVRAMSREHARLTADLRTQAATFGVEPGTRTAHAADRGEGKTGQPYETYRDTFFEQVGASWILCTVFVRTLEDRGYLPHRLAGPRAADGFAEFLAKNPPLDERDYLLQIFDSVARLPGGPEIFGRSSAPLWKLRPSSKAVGKLLDVFRVADGDVPRFSFGRTPGEKHDGESSRYLGDLYQDLNEGIRQRYGLIQTPEFLEHFLLDNTLDPAIRERGIAVTVLDPACGSGHILLGAFDRLYEARRRAEPGRPREESARTALGQVYGIDLNPYAVAIARFRLLLSYMDKADTPKMERPPTGVHFQVYVGDSLLAGQTALTTGLGHKLVTESENAHPLQKGTFSSFGIEADQLLANHRFDVVVSNPPYMMEKDAAKRDLIRRLYRSAAGNYSLSAPFVERIFQLGNQGAYTGQITSNSFMKREYGRSLIEDVLPQWDLTEVLDTSGAYIPGFGTPTVILLGRAQIPRSPFVRVVMGASAEPVRPDVPAEGKVWSAIASHHHHLHFTNEFISVEDVERRQLKRHPWTLGGGAILKDTLEGRTTKRLGDIAERIGFEAATHVDELFIVPVGCAKRWRLSSSHAVPYGSGSAIRDWTFNHSMDIVFPYTGTQTLRLGELGHFGPLVWCYRTTLWNRRSWGFQTKRETGGEYFEYSIFHPTLHFIPHRITFASIATHNHFHFDEEGKVFGRTAPIIKLPTQATCDEHLGLLAYLNSSTMCFWMKQVGAPRGRGGEPFEDWECLFEFSASQLSLAPVLNEVLRSDSAFVPLARDLVAFGQEWAAGRLTARTLDAILAAHPEDLRHKIDDVLARQSLLESRIRALQERLDWLVYAAFGLCSSNLVNGDVEERGPAERVSDILFARKVINGQGSRRYFQFDRMPEPEVVAAQPLSELDSRRLEAILGSPWLKLLEQPAYKRTYRPFSRPAEVAGACESWLCDRAEAALHEPHAISVQTLADKLHSDPRVRAVLQLLTGTTNYDLAPILADLLLKEAVAAAKCQRYTESGLEKRAEWEKTWDLQRREDAGEKVTIEIPPGYDKQDFENSAVVWPLRGKLDVPKERFIAYPSVTPPVGTVGKTGLVFGWAGWNHFQQFQAALELWQREKSHHHHDRVLPADRREREEALEDDEARARLMPILQVMIDLLPWVKQWHDPNGSIVRNFETYLHEQARWLEVSFEEVGAYRRPSRATGHARERENHRVPILKIERTILALHRSLGAGTFELRRAFRPNIVWSSEAQARLVESVLLRFPLPPIYVAEARNGTMRIIDGLQRLSALFGFLEGKLVLSRLRLLPELEGMRVADLPSRLRRRYEDTPLTLMVLGAHAHPRLQLEIFDRANAWAPLRDDEVRGEG